jgi:hypothetical protein
MPFTCHYWSERRGSSGHQQGGTDRGPRPLLVTGSNGAGCDGSEDRATSGPLAPAGLGHSRPRLAISARRSTATPPASVPIPKLTIVQVRLSIRSRRAGMRPGGRSRARVHAAPSPWIHGSTLAATAVELVTDRLVRPVPLPPECPASPSRAALATDSPKSAQRTTTLGE